MGNVYMEAEQVRFKDSTYHNLQAAVSAALEGGGGGGTTVIANPEGSATDDLSKLQVGTTIYGIPAEAGDISYDNTSSGMTADDVQEAIDELSAAMPGVATTSAPGIVQPDGTSITINDGVISAVGGGSGGETYSDTETAIGTWFGATLYRKVINCGALPNNTEKYISTGISGDITVRKMIGAAYNNQYYALPLAYVSDTDQYSLVLTFVGASDPAHPNAIRFYTKANLSTYTDSYMILEYTKNA